MIEFFEWMKKGSYSSRPWCLLGKGPTFARRKEVADLGDRFFLMGLNHVCREERVHVTHVIDANVLDEVPEITKRTGFLVMPWHPHVNFVPSKQTLDSFVKESPILQVFEEGNRLLWYNASTWTGKPHPGSPVVKVKWFSAEAAVRLLAMSGVKTIHTLGIDGGSQYAADFKDIQPFRGGHKSFDLQTSEIAQTVREFEIDYRPLLDKK